MTESHPLARRFLPLTLLLAAALIACSSRAPSTLGEDEGHPVFFPAPPEVPRIQFLASYSKEEDVTGGTEGFRSFVLGDEKQQEIGIIKPYGVAIAGGRILVCDTAWRRVWEMDVPGKAMRTLGDGTADLRKPVNVAVDTDGTRYVVDVGVHRLVAFDATGKFLRAIGDPEKTSPTSVAVGVDKLYVTDVNSGQIVAYDKASGNEVQRIGARGSADGQLFLPTNVALDAAGNLFVSDTGNFRIVKFDRTGTFVRNFGSLGRAPGQFARPKGVAVDRAGRLYVVDTAFENIQIFDGEGRLLMFFGFPGAKRGAMNVPAAVTIDYDNTAVFADKVAPGQAIEYLILVSSQYGPNKVNVYGFLKGQDGPAR